MSPARLLATLALAALPLVTTSCSDSEPSVPGWRTALEPGTYVGDVEGTDARVGLVVGIGSVTAFVCGGQSSLSTATTWANGDRAREGGTTLATPTRTMTLTRDEADERGNEVRGVVEGGPSPLRFVAQRVGSGTVAGVYEASDAEGRTGVVVDPFNRMQGAFVKQGQSTVFPVVVTSQVERETLKVTVQEREVVVKKVVSP
jgi:hypothetical protein